ncbi:two-component regulator propeller domain-containing protein [Segatella sp.]|uniref:type IX secretion system anionic LPS delivery protein PorZ n=1 Tax=Segatella sp. TaxID=2974253 RepID=UPI002ECF9BE6|nr:two-component regulator propeller domain-containing protein [Segatella copri]
MNKKISVIIIALLLQVVQLQAAIGDWKTYMAYHDVQEIEQAGNLVFVQASNNLYVYNQNDQSIQTFSKIDYLSDCDIEHIAYCQAAHRLLILYSNSNIDLMNTSNYEVTNLADYYNASTTGDKTIYDIYVNGKYAYMSNGFGIVKVNVADGEISDTYNLGFKVNWCEIKDNCIYAYSQTDGQYRAPLSVNLLDKNNWSKVGGYAAKQQADKSELKQMVSTLNPGGPKYNYFGFMKFANNQLYTCDGGFAVGISRKGCIQMLKNEEWNIYPDDNISSKTNVTYENLECLDYDPTDTSHIFVGGRNGLYEYKNGNFENYYNYENSPIERYNNRSKEYELITGVKFDKEGNLWMLNSQAPTQSLIEFTKDKQWISHQLPDLMKLDDAGFTNKSLGLLGNMLIDSRGLLWFVNNHWIVPSLYCYQFSEDNSEERLNAFTSFVNEDGTEVSVGAVRCAAEDKDGNIWIGTSAGPLLLDPNQITASAPTFTQVKVPRNDGTNYADYLLSGIDVSCIAVDGANRKWFGTKKNGIYLISEDNLSEIHHFTTLNSPLLSNGIESIAINEKTGEVFIGTDKGLCSYMSDSSTPNESMTSDNVWAYPNPVKPDYTGLITIVGLSQNADVKILTSNGRIVNEGKSNGGTYTWNGCDANGKKVASGIYMVATATNDVEKGTVCKIAIIK